MDADGSGQRRLMRHAKPKASSPGRLTVTCSPSERRTRRPTRRVRHERGRHRGSSISRRGLEAVSLSGLHGRKIGFRSLRDGSGEIYVVNVDGTGLRRLTRLTRNPVSSGWTTWSAPAWSPDGRKILFVRVGWGDRLVNSEIVVMTADGSRQRNLTPTRPTAIPSGRPTEGRTSSSASGTGTATST